MYAGGRYDQVGSFFGPAGGSFSIDAYGAQMARGLREPSDPRKMIRDAQSDLMLNAYYRFRDDLDADNERTDEETEALRIYKADLERHYGFTLDSVLNEKRDRSQNQLQQLETMLAEYGSDPVATRLLDSTTGQKLVDYMSARQVVVEEAAERGVVGWTSANATFDLRVALRGYGAQLATEDDGFAKMWEYMLDGEMVNDDDMLLAKPATPRPDPNVVTSPGQLATMSN